MDDFAEKLRRDPLNLGQFLMIVEGIRYINVLIFASGEVDKLVMPGMKPAKPRVKERLERCVNSMSGSSNLAGSLLESQKHPVELQFASTGLLSY